jgi:hypothetical protein
VSQKIDHLGIEAPENKEEAQDRFRSFGKYKDIVFPDPVDETEKSVEEEIDDPLA